MNKSRIEQLYQFCLIEQDRLGTYNIRMLDIAFNAVNIQELNHVVENTTSKRVQDYAMA